MKFRPDLVENVARSYVAKLTGLPVHSFTNSNCALRAGLIILSPAGWDAARSAPAAGYKPASMTVLAKRPF